ncbi:vacuolar ATPase [Hypoxylon argillaceum]|nr:vacuolar ATPase [Hypoxylon argillaceum]
MSAQNSTGIQTLLDAEREASKIVQKVRTKRVREARDEAKKEIDAYRKAKEEEFKKFEAEHTKGNKQAEDEANKEADGNIQEIQASGKKNQSGVVADLLKGVLDVKPVPPSAD